MGVYVFCPECEKKVMAGIQEYVVEPYHDKVFIFIYCGKCEMVLNLDRRVKLTVVKFEDEDEDKVRSISHFWVRIINILPVNFNFWLNRFKRWTKGSYYMPDYTTVMDVPEIVESAITQIEEMSGEKFGGDFNDFEIFMDRGVKAIVEQEEQIHVK